VKVVKKAAKEIVKISVSGLRFEPGTIQNEKKSPKLCNIFAITREHWDPRMLQGLYKRCEPLPFTVRVTQYVFGLI
jgi:hypothetical protein